MQFLNKIFIISFILFLSSNSFSIELDTDDNGYLDTEYGVFNVGTDADVVINYVALFPTETTPPTASGNLIQGNAGTIKQSGSGSLSQ